MATGGADLDWETEKEDEEDPGWGPAAPAAPAQALGGIGRRVGGHDAGLFGSAAKERGGPAGRDQRAEGLSSIS
ncbi:hypothetical protein PAMP_016163 [Pampus punctatissimus]